MLPFTFAGLLILLDVFGAVEGKTREQCVRILKVCLPTWAQ